MNHPADNERLLADVLADDAAAGFRAALFGETLRLARRRRRLRQARRTMAAVVAVVGLAALIWRSLPPQAPTPQAAGRGYVLVHTQPLPAAALVKTRPFSPDRLVASVATAGIVRTTAISGQIREIGDDDLLALAAPKPVALVRRGPHEAELVFVNQEDRDSLLRN
jgi:hypothetical protein